MVASLFGKELRQIAPEMRPFCFSTIEIHEWLWVKRRKELRETTIAATLSPSPEEVFPCWLEELRASDCARGTIRRYKSAVEGFLA